MGRLAVAITAILLGLSPAAQAAPACPGGRFVAHARAESVAPLLLVVGDDGRLSALGDCTVKPQKGERKWPLRAKLTGCEDAPRRVSLRGRWTDGCHGLTLAMRGKRFRRSLAASESACGDRLVDVVRHEECESFSDCAPRGTCGDDCRCQDIDMLPTDDTDCIPGALEARLGLDRSNPDSDGDGIDDGAEDLDGDGLPNCDEVARGTKLDDVDSDDDGASDLEEVTAGTDPLRPQSQTILPGEIVEGEITDAGRGSRYRFDLDSPRHVLIRAVDTTGRSSFGLCINTSDAAGAAQGGPKCGDLVANLARDFAAGTYTIVVSEVHRAETGTFQLEFLPLEATGETALPTGPDALVDAELPAPGFLRIHSFTLDGPRLVSVRIEARGAGAGLEPCFVVLTEGGERVPNSERCDGGTRSDRDVELAAGRYFVVVSDENNTSDGSYRLRVLPFHPAFARDLSSGAQCRTFDGLEDLDIYRITLPDEAARVVLSQESSEPGFMPCLRLWDENGLNLLLGSDGCTGPITVSPLPAGTYYATVHDDLRNATGSYCLEQR
jgi:hypothetical protein